MAFRSVQVPAAAHTANRNPIVDSSNKSHDNAVHSLVQVITSVAGRLGILAARRDRNSTGIWASRALLDRARPIGTSQSPGIVLEMPRELIVRSIRKPLCSTSC